MPDRTPNGDQATTPDPETVRWVFRHLRENTDDIPGSELRLRRDRPIWLHESADVEQWLDNWRDNLLLPECLTWSDHDE